MKIEVSITHLETHGGKAKSIETTAVLEIKKGEAKIIRKAVEPYGHFVDVKIERKT